MKQVEVSDTAVIGSEIEIQLSGSGSEKYYLLGAWDGDPDKRYISYKTKIGEALLDKKIGDSVEIPGAGKFTIKAVDALPEDLRKALACEN
jgi:transcription elongation GreA/GreB family factor